MPSLAAGALVAVLMGVGMARAADRIVPAGDTVRITMAEAESLFVRRNLGLLAARFNIEAARAAVVQAGLWNNPNVAIEQNIYNQNTGRYFDFTRTGNTDIAVQQLILLGGKRGRQVDLAGINASIAEATFADLLQSLRLELRTSLYDLHYLQQTLRFYDESLGPLRATLDAAAHGYEQRSILLSELLRLKSLVVTLESERLDVRTKITGLEGELQTLLGDTATGVRHYRPLLTSGDRDGIKVDTISVAAMIGRALERRPDVRIAESSVAYEENNLALQKAMAIPDVTVGGHWSRNGGYIPDYYAVTVAVDLPLFNRNQGNIEVSEQTLRSNRAALEQTRQKIRKEVANAYDKAAEIDRLYRTRDTAIAGEYRTLVNGMVSNYEKRNMTVIEFTDFFESYRASMTQLIQIENDRMDALEELNAATGMSLW